jgi:hypothetical protein
MAREVHKLELSRKVQVCPADDHLFVITLGHIWY